MEGKISKLDFIKMKNAYSKKYTFKRMNKQATNWDKIIAKCISDTALVPKIYEELLREKIGKHTAQLKNGKGSKQTKRSTDGKSSYEKL